MKLIPAPVSPVERLTAQLREYFFLPDPGPLYILAGAVAANMIEGVPVWLMLVGPPSCGKSEMLNAFLSVPRMVEAADIASEAAFLSGSPAKDTAKDATGGLLRQVGDFGGLIINDFTSILSKPSEKIMAIMAVFRETFIGRWTRHIGGEGGRIIQWRGKLAIFAGCTGSIDQHHHASASLGERWIYYRYPEDKQEEYYAECRMALGGRAETYKDGLRDLITGFFVELGLYFEFPVPRRVFTTSETIKLHQLALLAVRCRSAVYRDSYSKEVDGALESERPQRIASVLGQLLQGMERIGVPEKTRWRLLARVTLDSMPMLRKQAIQSVVSGPVSLETITAKLKCSANTAKRTVEDLVLHEVLVSEDNHVRLSEWMATAYKKINK